jgi:hypothetical protein
MEPSSTALSKPEVALCPRLRRVRIRRSDSRAMRTESLRPLTIVSESSLHDAEAATTRSSGWRTASQDKLQDATTGEAAAEAEEATQPLPLRCSRRLSHATHEPWGTGTICRLH